MARPVRSDGVAEIGPPRKLSGVRLTDRTSGDIQRRDQPMISALFDLTCIELNRLVWRHGLNIRRFAAADGALSVTDQSPLETGQARQDFSMQDYIESQNIANFRERLRMEADPVRQKILLQLLADETAKYAARIKVGVQAKP
jgi:hypothetical protein